jgi:alkylation response protein AidB-like acyl-CoA dehydrogenase
MADICKASGGSFLLEPVGARPILTPEHFTDDQRAMHKAAADFMAHEVLPRTKDIEVQKPGVVPNLIRKAGEVGLLSLEIPEEFGGLGMDVATSMLVGEVIARHGSFSVSLGAHVGIGTLPIVYFGNDKQREKYLPKLNTGELIAAYALTEPTSGSDALGAKTRAVLNPEGTHYVLNGSKQWITNAGFADVFIVFAKVDGEKFTGFIVERGTPGFSIGNEEHKMGIRGSSTCQLTFEDAPVPKENVLGEIGKGHKIAFNILNHGRLKLGVGSNGGSKHILGTAIAYGKARKAFGHAITDFGLIREKIGEMADRIFVSESMGYNICGMIDELHHALDPKDPDFDKKRFNVLEEFNIESSILKVYGTEASGFVADQAVQIHGGYGYSEEYAVERAYRDVRINRIFEGTNEVNRMLIPGTLLKRGMQGKLLLMDSFGLLGSEIEEGKLLPPEDARFLGVERRVAEACKRQALFALQQSAMRYMQEIEKEQEILALIADLCIDVFGMVSSITRATQMHEAKHQLAGFAEKMTKLFVAQANARVAAVARQVIVEAAPGDAQKVQTVQKLGLPYDTSLITLRREIADVVIEKEAYPL